VLTANLEGADPKSLRDDMAQGGGTNPAALPGALESVLDWVEERV